MLLMPLRKSMLWLALACVLALGGPPNPAKATQGIDGLIAELMTAYSVPGAAVGVWADGRVIFAKGYGVRSTRTKAPVTPDTLFAVGSITKSFTALTAAMQVDAGKLQWDRPVREFLPWFRMYDPVANELITPRDLLTHRSGLPRHDFIRFSTPLARAELVRRIQFLPNSRTFRDVYQYNNLMYVTAGFLAGHVAGMEWEDLVRTRVFQPLGMSASTVTVDEMQRRSDFASPHDDGAVVDFYDYQRFGVGPNGAVNSSVNDLLKYLAFYLDDKQQLLSQEQRRQLWRPVTVSGDGAYALGWQVGWHRGYRMVDHSGSITGFSAHAAILPDHHVAITVLTNSGSSLPTLATLAIADRMLGLPPVDRLKELQSRRPSAGSARTPVQQVTASALKLSPAAGSLAGTYRHPAYGEIPVRLKGDGLEVVFPAMTVTMKHYQNDNWEFGTGRGQLASFVLDSVGKPTALRLPLEPSIDPLVFDRVK